MANTTGSNKLDDYLKNKTYQHAFKRLFIENVQGAAKQQSNQYSVDPTDDLEGFTVRFSDLTCAFTFLFNDQECFITDGKQKVSPSLHCNVSYCDDDQSPKILEQNIKNLEEYDFDGFLRAVVIPSLERQINN